MLILNRDNIRWTIRSAAKSVLSYQKQLRFHSDATAMSCFSAATLSNVAFYLTAETWKLGEYSLKNFMSTRKNELSKQPLWNTSTHVDVLRHNVKIQKKMILLLTIIIRLCCYDDNFFKAIRILSILYIMTNSSNIVQCVRFARIHEIAFQVIKITRITSWTGGCNIEFVSSGTNYFSL